MVLKVTQRPAPMPVQQYCPQCGSDDLLFDVICTWNPDRQIYESTGDQAATDWVHCQNCDEVLEETTTEVYEEPEE